MPLRKTAQFQILLAIEQQVIVLMHKIIERRQGLIKTKYKQFSFFAKSFLPFKHFAYWSSNTLNWNSQNSHQKSFKKIKNNQT